MSGTISYTGGTTSLSEIRISAPLQVSSGTIVLTDTAATGNTVGGLVVSGGTLEGPGALTDNGNLTWTGSSGGFIMPGGTLTQPAGFTTTFSTTSANASINGWGVSLGSPTSISGSFTLGFSGSISALGNVTMADGSTVGNNGGGTFGVSGALSKPSGTGTATINPAVNLSGTVEVDNGTLDFLTGGNASAPMTIASGATLGIRGVTLSSSATVSGGGTLDALDTNATATYDGSVSVGTLLATGNTSGKALFNAPLTVSGTLTASAEAVAFGGSGSSVGGVVLNGGSLEGPGSVTDNGNLNWTGSSGGFITPGGTFTQPAGFTTTFSTTSANASINGWGVSLGSPTSISGSFTLGFSGSISALGNVTMADGSTVGNNGGGTFGVSGALSKPSGTGTATIKPAVNLSGTVEVDTGTLDLLGGGSAAGRR